MKKLAIIITHPIQYYVPVFKQLAKACRLKVFYTWGEAGAKSKFDPDFQQVISWDLPLLEGYNYQFLENHAKNPGSHHFSGVKNKDLISSVTDFAPDAILVYGWAYQSHLYALRHFQGKIPVWFRGDSTLLDHGSGLKSLSRSLFLKWVYRHVDLAFYVGSANKAYFEKFGLADQQLVFAPHAIENKRFSENWNEESGNLREKLGIKTTDQLLLFAGKLENKKNPKLLLQTFLELNLQSIHLLFVGNGELQEQLKALAHQQAQGVHKIHFMDFQNQRQMPVIYQACDLFVLPSQGPGETWGLAVNEAMAAGKAVLVSDKVGCASDLVYRGQNGDIFRSNDLNDLESKLNKLLSNPSELMQMGIKSKQIISDWNIDKQVRIFLKTLND